MNCYESLNHWAAVLFLHLTLKSGASVSHTKKSSGSWKVREHIFSSYTLWAVKPLVLLPNKSQLDLSAGPERMNVSWGQSGRDPQTCWRTPVMGQGRGPCWVPQLPQGLGTMGCAAYQRRPWITCSGAGCDHNTLCHQTRPSIPSTALFRMWSDIRSSPMLFSVGFLQRGTAAWDS